MNAQPPKSNSGRQPILVTGGCGFIGSNLASALAARGDTVLVFDSLARAGTERNAEWLRARWGDRVRIELGDIRDFDRLSKVVADCAAVLHLAAQVAVTSSVDDPLHDFETNARGTVNVLEAIRRFNPQAPLIFASTNKVYGKLLAEGDIERRDDRYLPRDPALRYGVPETTPLDLYSPYGCSKGAADQYVHDYARIYGLRTVVLRMSCIYGPRQFGTEDQGWIAHFLLQMMCGSPITIYGDGYQVRDALFVDDAVAAWLGILKSISRTAGRVFNLGGGTGNAVSLRQMLQMLGEQEELAPAIRYASWRPGDQPWYVSDVRALSQAIGWTPSVPLRDGLVRLAAWLREDSARPASTELNEVGA
jgi:CDP-paratose 2-epimerase